MDAEMKLALLLAVIFLGVVFFAFLVTIRSIGNITHSLQRLKEITAKETILSYNRKVSDMKSEEQRAQATQERNRRQEALLNVPLIRKEEGGK